jgi:hypothetical protein
MSLEHAGYGQLRATKSDTFGSRRVEIGKQLPSLKYAKMSQ